MTFGNSMLKYRCECGNLKRPLPTEPNAPCGAIWAFRCDDCYQRLTGVPGSPRAREFLEKVEESFAHVPHDPIFERQLIGLADVKDTTRAA